LSWLSNFVLRAAGRSADENGIDQDRQTANDSVSFQVSQIYPTEVPNQPDGPGWPKVSAWHYLIPPFALRDLKQSRGSFGSRGFVFGEALWFPQPSDTLSREVYAAEFAESSSYGQRLTLQFQRGTCSGHSYSRIQIWSPASAKTFS
jgi:hypothetical protein